MYRNNYDVNSKGINIELIIERDEHLAHCYFNENFERIGNNKFLYVDFKNIDSKNIDLEKCIKHISYGYCQGDIVTVLIPIDELKKCWGVKKIDLESLKKEIDKFIWNIPLYIYLKYNGTVFYTTDFYDDDYVEFEKEDFIKRVKEKIKNDKAVEEIEKLIPDNFEL